MTGKFISHFLKMLSVSFVIVCYTISVIATGSLPNSDSTFGIIQIGLFIMTVSSPIDISMFISAIKRKNDEE
jgi:hypothetical protein